MWFFVSVPGAVVKATVMPEHLVLYDLWQRFNKRVVLESDALAVKKIFKPLPFD